jgi:hypothetical protein
VPGNEKVTRRCCAGRTFAAAVQRVQWTVEDGTFAREEFSDRHTDLLHEALKELKKDLIVADFLNQHFCGPEYCRLRRSILKMVQSYDATDPERASTLALRDEWMNGGPGTAALIVGGYGEALHRGVIWARSRPRRKWTRDGAYRPW